MVVLVVGIGPTVLGPPSFKQAGLFLRVVCVVCLSHKSFFFMLLRVVVVVGLSG